MNQITQDELPTFPREAPAWSQTRLGQLRYESAKLGAKTTQLIKLSRNSSVSKTMLEWALKMFWRNAYQLRPKRRHRVKSLCGGPEWDSCSDVQRQAIGRCIKYLARNSVLPITLAHTYYPLAYLLNGDLGVDPLSQ